MTMISDYDLWNWAYMQCLETIWKEDAKHMYDPEQNKLRDFSTTETCGIEADKVVRERKKRRDVPDHPLQNSTEWPNGTNDAYDQVKQPESKPTAAASMAMFMPTIEDVLEKAEEFTKTAKRFRSTCRAADAINVILPQLTE